MRCLAVVNKQVIDLSGGHHPIAPDSTLILLLADALDAFPLSFKMLSDLHRC